MTGRRAVTYALRVCLPCNAGRETQHSLNPPQLVMNITVVRIGLA
jgi:hypothetical protein